MTSVRRSVGRPRDPGFEDRAKGAALGIYAERGWSGLNFNAVAREAGLGKASLYSRWESVGELLIAALDASVQLPVDVDTGSLTGDLRALARRLWEHYCSPAGLVSVRINLDAQVVPELAAPYRRYIREFGRVNSAIVTRAVERGEMHDSADRGVIVELVLGALMLRAMFTPDRATYTDVESDDVVRAVVDAAVRGMR